LEDVLLLKWDEILVVNAKLRHMTETRFQHHRVGLRGEGESGHRGFSGQLLARNGQYLEVLQHSGEEYEETASGEGFAKTSPPACGDKQ
jgi:hypothetical protein